jgi:hypothetical protein
MNAKRWEDPSVPLVVLALKLTEEAAEVGTEISDMLMKAEMMSPPFTREAEILAELEHVEFFCRLIRARMT